MMALYPTFIAQRTTRRTTVMAMIDAAIYCLYGARETGRGDVLAAIAARQDDKLEARAVRDLARRWPPPANAPT